MLLKNISHSMQSGMMRNALRAQMGAGIMTLNRPSISHLQLLARHNSSQPSPPPEARADHHFKKSAKTESGEFWPNHMVS
jgi:hypothetical protein